MIEKDIAHLNSSVFCRLGASPIEGVGVFAIRDMPKGTPISNWYGGEMIAYEVTEEEFELIDPDVKRLITDRTAFIEGMPLSFVSPNCNQILESFMNHSETPNTDGFETVRDVKRGEELTKSYRDFPKLHRFSTGLINTLNETTG